MLSESEMPIANHMNLRAFCGVNIKKFPFEAVFTILIHFDFKLLNSNSKVEEDSKAENFFAQLLTRYVENAGGFYRRKQSDRTFFGRGRIG
jgi:hypothetical protein